MIVFLLAGPIARLMHHGDIEGTLRWISLLLLTGGLSRTHETWLMKHLQFKVLALRSLVSICIGGGIGIVMAVNGYGLLSLIAQQLITSVVGTACLWLATTWRPGFDTRWENIASLLRYFRHVSLAAVAAFANSQSDVFFSYYYLGPAMTGVYAAAKCILSATSLMFSSGLNSVALPTMAAVSSFPQFPQSRVADDVLGRPALYWPRRAVARLHPPPDGRQMGGCGAGYLDSGRERLYRVSLGL